MSKHQVTVHTRTLNLIVRAEFASEALADQWAHRIFKAKEKGTAITVGNVRLVGPEIVSVEFGPVGGLVKVIGQHPAMANAAAEDILASH
jgi:hypothetical protein